jgi:hypothetical protein
MYLMMLRSGFTKRLSADGELELDTQKHFKPFDARHWIKEQLSKSNEWHVDIVILESNDLQVRGSDAKCTLSLSRPDGKCTLCIWSVSHGDARPKSYASRACLRLHKSQPFDSSGISINSSLAC